MKDIYKNPIFFYVLIPVVIGLWPLLLRMVYLPAGQRSLAANRADYTKAKKTIHAILELDPARLEFAAGRTEDTEFDYTNAVNKVSQLCGISSAKYRLSSGIIITSGGQKTQNAKLTLKGLAITQFARFLSTMQLRWANLQCTKIKLTKKKDLPDSWDVDLDFKYYY